MSRQIQIRRGTATQHDNFTGVIGEITMDTTNKTLRVHDGVTPGGNEVMLSNNFYSDVSNCVSEIPNNINLNLNNGILTLKSGSKIYRPNGTNVFDEYVLSDDKNYSWASDGNWLLYMTTENNFDIVDINNVFSGSSEPTGVSTYSLWYDTSNNTIKKTSDGGTTWDDGGGSFPICIFSVSNGAISELSQIFNGFGFIGSTVFMLPGVKGLYPDGKNADGTLKSGAINVTGVKIYNVNNTSTKVIRLSGAGLFGYQGYIVSDIKPSVNFNMWYNPSDNIMYDTGGGTPSKLNASIAGFVNYDGTRITSFAPKTTFHIVDYNDSEFIANQSMPSKRYIDLTLGTSGTSYTAPGNGYFTINKAGNSGEWMYMLNTDTNMNVSMLYSASLNGRLFMPVTRGTKIQIQYSASGTTNMFRFVYANGSK